MPSASEFEGEIRVGNRGREWWDVELEVSFEEVP